ncbi:unnamed protein product [Kuraishia capsulata CBS 1993]|uniref:Uncharacterized protein n=1 Tax=Kuraishia capsulata CBS 1993 TaxID=1382522 RepID=W6MPD8_9ASCO|nr:uncharacterized protein KUCA_T00004160001 [Kuraishia capsulata CBS 1993]CDK28178.1 unnamed protein product [Kuraishia capsulata CBS 1993]
MVPAADVVAATEVMEATAVDEVVSATQTGTNKEVSQVNPEAHSKVSVLQASPRAIEPVALVEADVLEAVLATGLVVVGTVLVPVLVPVPVDTTVLDSVAVAESVVTHRP